MPGTTAVLSDPLFKRHSTGAAHPEQAARMDAIASALEKSGAMADAPRIEPRAAAEDEIALCHTRPYIELVKREVAGGARMLSTGDTQVGPESLEVALHAAGGVLNAVDAVLGRRARNAFCAIRPPGHHATADRGMGFCLFNNVAVAARYAQKKHGIGNVLIVDWDVHHGNGTQDIFYGDGSVFYFSTHQSPWYPGTGATGETGEGKGAGLTMNCPFPSGSGETEILGAFRNRLVPAMRDFKPELVVLSAGFDSRLGDPLGEFTLSDGNFAELTALMLEMADRSAGGRLVSVLEGGYNLAGLGAAAASHVDALRRG